MAHGERHSVQCDLRAADEFRQHGGDRVSEVLRGDDVRTWGKTVDLDAVEIDDELLRFTDRDVRCGGTCLPPLSHTQGTVTVTGHGHGIRRYGTTLTGHGRRSAAHPPRTRSRQ
jgi:hypothetical protein